MRASKVVLDFPCSLVGEESACSAGDPGSIPGLGRFPGEGNGNPLQHSCLENPMDRGAWQLQSMGSQELGTTWRLNRHQQVVLVVKNPPVNAGDMCKRHGFSPWVGKNPWMRAP